MMLALTAHVTQAYGGLRPDIEPARGGLAPWQVKRACEKLESDLVGKLPLEQIAAEFDLSVSHFSRAFRISTGLPPHQWLLRQRVKTAKQLMSVRDLPGEQRAAWQEIFRHYVFEPDADTAGHIPEDARRTLAPMTPEVARELRARLLQRLNR